MHKSQGISVHKIAQHKNYKFSIKNDLTCAWRDFKKKWVAFLPYLKEMVEFLIYARLKICFPKFNDPSGLLCVAILTHKQLCIYQACLNRISEAI